MTSENIATRAQRETRAWLFHDQPAYAFLGNVVAALTGSLAAGPLGVHDAIGGALGAIAFCLLIFVWNLAAAPFRQRNEARREAEGIRAALAAGVSAAEAERDDIAARLREQHQRWDQAGRLPNRLDQVMLNLSAIAGHLRTAPDDQVDLEAMRRQVEELSNRLADDIESFGEPLVSRLSLRPGQFAPDENFSTREGLLAATDARVGAINTAMFQGDIIRIGAFYG